MRQNNSLKKVCILGSSDEGALSPSLHHYWMDKYGIEGKCSYRSVELEDLAQALAELESEGYLGCNLTTPLKEKARGLMDEVCGSCEATNMTNTVVFNQGRRIGYNSDWFAFINSLNDQVPDWERGRSVIIGAGDAARSVMYALMLEGVKEFVFTNRTTSKIEKIAEDLGLKDVEVVDWENRSEALKNASLVVNCTSLGARGNPPLDISLDLLPESATVCDLVCNPVITPLLKESIKRGNKVAEGLPMVLHQGKLGFKKWFGIDPEIDTTLYTRIKAEL